jgi:hypothetical protein
MEKIIPMEEWLKTLVVEEVEYYAVYNDDGSIQFIYPCSDPSQAPLPNIKIEKEIGIDINEGRSNIFNYRIDLKNKKIQKIDDISKVFGLSKIDDVLHRVIDKKWSNIVRPDVFIVYSKKESLLTFSINPLLKEADWSGEQEMIFLVTEYNDPNSLKEMIRFTVNELIKYPQKIQMDLPEKFSVYTRRLFDNYTIELI